MTLEELKAIKRGDVVTLNSGSPNMTVTQIEASWITCNYWDSVESKFKNITLDYAELTNIK